VRLTAERLTISKPKFAVGDIVKVPFPFVEAPRVRNRRALVTRVAHPADGMTLLWVLMITSAENKAWIGDISLIEHFATCGLPVPSVIRTAKVATVESARATILGRLPEDLLKLVRQQIAE